MSSPVLSHVIETSALIAMLILIVASYQLIYSNLYFNVIATQLREVADHVSSITTDLVILASTSSKEDMTLIKRLEIPMSIGYLGYTINMSADDKKVKVFLDRYPSVGASAILPWVGGNLTVYNGSLPGSLPGVKPEKAVSGGALNLVVWCRVQNEVITIGLGYNEGVKAG